MGTTFPIFKSSGSVELETDMLYSSVEHSVMTEAQDFRTTFGISVAQVRTHDFFFFGGGAIQGNFSMPIKGERGYRPLLVQTR